MWKLMKYNVKGAVPGLRQFLATESLLKMMKMLLILPWEALFVRNVFKVLSYFFGHVENGLIRKVRLISKFMRSQPGKQTIAIHLMSNISRSKGNQVA